MNTGLEFAQKLSLAYERRCKPLCRQWKLTQTALDILLFLANNPEYDTARDIVEIRKIKANLVSVNVNRLVERGYLDRQAVAGDRRKIRLVLTAAAQPIVEAGRTMQTKFGTLLFRNVSAADQAAFSRAMAEMSKNMDAMLEDRV